MNNTNNARAPDSPVGPDLDHEPVELRSTSRLAPSFGITDSGGSFTSVGSNSDAESLDSPSYDHEQYNSRSDVAESNNDDDDEDTARLQPFDYPVLFSPSEDISFVGPRE